MHVDLPQTAPVTSSGLHVRDVWLESPTGQRLLHQVSFSLPPSCCLGMVGESGSGKSLTSQALMNLTGPGFRRGGEVLLEGQSLLALDNRAMRRLCGSQLALIPQQPMTAFDPLQRVGNQIAETLRQHVPLSARQAREQAITAMEQVRLPHPEQLYRRYPSELSGGMLQRAAIALVLALRPRWLIADEPTSALDEDNRREVVRLLQDLRAQGCGLLLISHDFSLLDQMADRLVVMQQGRSVEYGEYASLLHVPRHACTRQWVASVQALAGMVAVDKEP
ncbi:ABC transporter ATP-binding protein [Musicola keenii]|uniref:ABC transporter ATP-binding protein n=1 Tax=Musicola keenii TaxID=2884250 RepID=UPI0017819B42|nr:ABC transporter ATP-binding protein [Musicola keenii]